MANKSKVQILGWIIGGIAILILVSFGVYKVVQANKKSNNSSSNSVENNDKPNLTSPPLGELPILSKENELEKYLLEKRLDLQKYFVFNLGKEVKLEVVKTNLLINSQQVNMDNGRLVVPSLSNHLTKLTGETKKAICFLGKDTKSVSDEWTKEKLNQKISQGEQCYIIFDKTQITSDICNYFAKQVGAFGTSFPTVCALAMEDKNVWVAWSKEEALEFLKINDPALKWTLGDK